eukprot:3179231-Rhodomonas_salina.2
MHDAWYCDAYAHHVWAYAPATLCPVLTSGMALQGCAAKSNTFHHNLRHDNDEPGVLEKGYRDPSEVLEDPETAKSNTEKHFPGTRSRGNAFDLAMSPCAIMMPCLVQAEAILLRACYAVSDTKLSKKNILKAFGYGPRAKALRKLIANVHGDEPVRFKFTAMVLCIHMVAPAICLRACDTVLGTDAKRMTVFALRVWCYAAATGCLLLACSLVLLVTQCPVLTPATLVCCCATSGTDTGYATMLLRGVRYRPTHSLCGVRYWHSVRYAMSGTEIAMPCGVWYSHSRCYAMSGTDIDMLWDVRY